MTYSRSDAMHKPPPLETIVAVLIVVAPVLVGILGFTTEPRHDVPEWLQLRAGELDQCTLYVQIVFFLAALLGLSTVAVSVLITNYASAAAFFVGSIWGVIAIAFVLPHMTLGYRAAMPPAGITGDPILVPTNFDFRAFQAQLWPQLVDPAICALAGAAVVTVGAAITLAVRRHLHRRAIARTTGAVVQP